MTTKDSQHDTSYDDEADPGLAGFDDPLEHLRGALRQDELQIYCQPIRALHATAERYPIAEVLVRMREEENALLPPGDFLPVFEHYRMLTDLDCWVAEKTLHWIAREVPGSIRSFSINVSSQSLDDTRLLDCITAALGASGVRPELLYMEIDEVDTLLKAEATERFVQAVRSIGCGIVIDGFARRSVSFTAVKALQPDFVKVDGAIVRKLATSAVAQLKLKSIVRVGAVTGIGIIAECVEDDRVLAQLEELSVGYAQGFGIAVPQPIETGGIAPRDSA